MRDYEIAVPAAEPEPSGTASKAAAPVAAAESTHSNGAPAGLSALRNALLPEGAQAARFTTTLGADSKTVSGTVYAAQAPGDELRLLWVKVDEQIIPTSKTTPSLGVQRAKLMRGPQSIPSGATPACYRCCTHRTSCCARCVAAQTS